jgi:hypothetical protein
MGANNEQTNVPASNLADVFGRNIKAACQRFMSEMQRDRIATPTQGNGHTAVFYGSL